MDKQFKIIFGAFIFMTYCIAGYGATIGGPDISIPEGSLYLKQKAVNDALNRYDYNWNIKSSAELEYIVKRKLETSREVTGAKIEGENFVLRLSTNFGEVVEPYINIGTCNLEVKWNQNGNKVEVDTKPGLVWGGGAKVKVWESSTYKVKLTLDAQYRKISADIESININSSTDEDFDIDQWQVSLLASKKYILPIGLRDYYVVPYGGVVYSMIDVDVKFKQSTTGLLYSTYNANDKSELGIVMGFDVMPSLSSWYLFNFELRLINETAFSLGGTVKF